ncbi:MAG TPA: SDR family oxidoreductase [Gaiella sp.]|nr:SDR family oxidoreductase [Gaiella sp.]
MTLDSKCAVVTGGGSGLGHSICVRLAADGARVAVLDVDAEAASRTADLVGGVAVRADVSSSPEVERALETAEAELGPVDVWVNNAGIPAVAQAERVIPRAEQQLAEAADGRITTPLDALVRLPDDEWRRMLAVHLDGTFYGTRAAARSMAPRGTGSIVNIASVCGIEGCAGYPHYSAAKGGILAFTRAVAKELAVQGVRVNAIAPGFIETPTAGMQGQDVRRALRLRIPLGRFGQSEEVAATVAFLAGDDGAYYVGETLSPNGGIVTV